NCRLTSFFMVSSKGSRVANGVALPSDASGHHDFEPEVETVEKRKEGCERFGVAFDRDAFMWELDLADDGTGKRAARERGGGRGFLLAIRIVMEDGVFNRDEETLARIREADVERDLARAGPFAIEADGERVEKLIRGKRLYLPGGALTRLVRGRARIAKLHRG